MPIPQLGMLVAGTVTLLTVAGIIIVQELRNRHEEEEERECIRYLANPHFNSYAEYHQYYYGAGRAARLADEKNEPTTHVSLAELQRHAANEPGPWTGTETLPPFHLPSRSSPAGNDDDNDDHGRLCYSETYVLRRRKAAGTFRIDQFGRTEEDIQREYSYLQAMEQANERRWRELQDEKRALARLEAEVQARRAVLATSDPFAVDGKPRTVKTESGSELSPGPRPHDPTVVVSHPASVTRTTSPDPFAFGGGSTHLAGSAWQLERSSLNAPPVIATRSSVGSSSTSASSSSARLNLSSQGPAESAVALDHTGGQDSPSDNYASAANSLLAPSVPSLMPSHIESSRMSDLSTVLTAMENEGLVDVSVGSVNDHAHPVAPPHVASSDRVHSPSSRRNSNVSAGLGSTSDASWVELASRGSQM
ncbi:hypothetical protein IWQ60_001910 [Tieghemiomyces parasiticus]|uniref:Uncharacterized protein n=1 Tax=Tieghemiomyces parasiticus TaxID=78921 RepID=A0A9W8ADN8_9FUNG|nr:hypothetical protein IWQ60_001910 [Tieghemiomyces parasiticus]